MAYDAKKIYYRFDDHLSRLVLDYEASRQISPESENLYHGLPTAPYDEGLFVEHNVKRGLRNADGSGVVAGLTRISDVHGYNKVDGKVVPDQGKLTLRGYSIEDLVNNAQAEDRYGYEEVAYLLITGSLPTKEELDEHMHMLEEAKKRDHRKIGREMDLFMMRDAAPGFPFFLPNGMILNNTLLEYWREIHHKAGYVEISTPLIMNKQLWKTSGHWDHYKDNMYSTVIDDEEYCIKPMNCPGGVLVYASKPHSYRELPIRAGEIGLVHRHELRGALHGLFRVRCFNQDDAHLFVRPDQLTDEIVGVVNLIDSVYQKFGFKYRVELSTRPEDSMGSDEDWARAEEGLRTALEKLGMDYEVNEGDGAFYGPKIDFHLEDSLGRTWQCGTVQLDFQMPLNFDLEYVDADGTKKRPIMLHRVCFGSIERFIGILIEHFAGKFPTWLAPVQVKALPVSEKSRDYAHEVCAKLEEAGIRVVCDDRDEKIGYKIREARSIDRVPYMLILGEKEVEAGNISVRDRSNETVQMSVDEFVAKVTEEIKTRA